MHLIPETAVDGYGDSDKEVLFMGHVRIVSSEHSGRRHAETRRVQRKEEKFVMFFVFFSNSL